MSSVEVLRLTDDDPAPILLPDGLYDEVDRDPDRSLLDIVGPEGFRRAEIDRSIGYIDALFAATLGPDKTPIVSATEVLRRDGKASLLDVGCGTGQTLRTWGLSVAKAARRPLSAVTLTGISMWDYSRESCYPATTKAHLDGRMRYLVGDAADLPIEDNSVDVALAHASFIYSPKPAKWLEEMMRVSKPGSAIYFDTSDFQIWSGKPIMNFIDQVEETGAVFEGVRARITTPTKARTRAFCRLVKPSI